jgi:hypothetical protein
MKKILLLIISIYFLTTGSDAQMNKGAILLGGDLSFSTTTSKDGTNKSRFNGFTVAPVFAKAIKQNVFWGGSVSFSSSSNTPSPAYSSSKNKAYGAGVFYRRYYPVKNKFYVFLQAGASTGFGTDKYRQGPDYNSNDKRIFAGLNITPGVSIAVTKKLYLESGFSNIAALNYQRSKTTGYNSGNSINRSSGSFGFSSSLSAFSSGLYFGFRFILDK